MPSCSRQAHHYLPRVVAHLNAISGRDFRASLIVLDGCAAPCWLGAPSPTGTLQRGSNVDDRAFGQLDAVVEQLKEYGLLFKLAGGELQRNHKMTSKMKAGRRKCRHCLTCSQHMTELFCATRMASNRCA